MLCYITDPVRVPTRSGGKRKNRSKSRQISNLMEDFASDIGSPLGSNVLQYFEWNDQLRDFSASKNYIRHCTQRFDIVSVALKEMIAQKNGQPISSQRLDSVDLLKLIFSRSMITKFTTKAVIFRSTQRFSEGLTGLELKQLFESSIVLKKKMYVLEFKDLTTQGAWNIGRKSRTVLSSWDLTGVPNTFQNLIPLIDERNIPNPLAFRKLRFMGSRLEPSQIRSWLKERLKLRQRTINQTAPVFRKLFKKHGQTAFFLVKLIGHRRILDDEANCHKIINWIGLICESRERALYRYLLGARITRKDYHDVLRAKLRKYGRSAGDRSDTQTLDQALKATEKQLVKNVDRFAGRSRQRDIRKARSQKYRMLNDIDLQGADDDSPSSSFFSGLKATISDFVTQQLFDSTINKFTAKVVGLPPHVKETLKHSIITFIVSLILGEWVAAASALLTISTLMEWLNGYASGAIFSLLAGVSKLAKYFSKVDTKLPPGVVLVLNTGEVLVSADPGEEETILLQGEDGSIEETTEKPEELKKRTFGDIVRETSIVELFCNLFGIDDRRRIARLKNALVVTRVAAVTVSSIFFVKTLISGLGKMFFGNDPFDPNYRVAMQTVFEANRIVINNLATWESQNTTENYSTIVQMVELYKAGEFLDGWLPKSDLARTDKARTQLFKLYEARKNQNFLPHMEVRPAVCYFLGPSGTGKTLAMKYLAKLMTEFYNCDETVRAYSYAATDAFTSGYQSVTEDKGVLSGHLVFTSDDAFQKVEQASRAEESTFFITKVADNARSLVMPELEKKGCTFFNSYYYLATTNVADFNHSAFGIQSDAAMKRRMDLVVVPIFKGVQTEEQLFAVRQAVHDVRDYTREIILENKKVEVMSISDIARALYAIRCKYEKQNAMTFPHLNSRKITVEGKTHVPLSEIESYCQQAHSSRMPLDLPLSIVSANTFMIQQLQMKPILSELCVSVSSIVEDLSEHATRGVPVQKLLDDYSNLLLKLMEYGDSEERLDRTVFDLCMIHLTPSPVPVTTGYTEKHLTKQHLADARYLSLTSENMDTLWRKYGEEGPCGPTLMYYNFPQEMERALIMYELHKNSVTINGINFHTDVEDQSKLDTLVCNYRRLFNQPALDARAIFKPTIGALPYSPGPTLELDGDEDTGDDIKTEGFKMLVQSLFPTLRNEQSESETLVNTFYVSQNVDEDSFDSLHTPVSKQRSSTKIIDVSEDGFTRGRTSSGRYCQLTNTSFDDVSMIQRMLAVCKEHRYWLLGLVAAAFVAAGTFAAVRKYRNTREIEVQYSKADPRRAQRGTKQLSKRAIGTVKLQGDASRPARIERSFVKLAKSLLRVSTSGMNGRSNTMNGFWVGKGKFAMPAHGLPSSPYIAFTIYTEYVRDGCIQFEVAKNSIVGVDADLVLVSVPESMIQTHCMTPASITRYKFPAFGDNFSLDECFYVNIYEDQDMSGRHILTHYTDVEVFNHDDISYTTADGQRVKQESPLRYSLRTFDGDCGGFLVKVTPNDSLFVIGMHIGSTHGTHQGVAKRLTDKHWNALSKFMEVRDVVPDVTSSAPTWVGSKKQLAELGVVDIKIPNQPMNNSRIRKSKLYGVFHEPTMAPAEMTQETTSIALDKMVTLDDSPITCATELTNSYEFLRSAYGSFQAVPLTLHEALNGRKGKYPVEPLNMQTSCGIMPNAKTSKSNYVNTSYDPDTGERVLTPTRELEEMYYKVLNIVKKGDVIAWHELLMETPHYGLMQAKRKDEKLPAGTKKVRLYFCLNFVITLVARTFWKPIDSYFKKFFRDLMFQVGVNAQQPVSDWAGLYKRFRPDVGEVFPNVVAGDFHRFDQSIRKDVMSLAFRFFNETGYQDVMSEERVAGDMLAEIMCNVVFTLDGKVYQLSGINPSGNPVTSTINSVVLGLVLYSACQRILPNRWQEIDGAFYGDDNLLRFPEPIDPKQLPLLIKEMFGMTYTAPDKTDNVQLAYIDDVDFLSRSFVLTEYTSEVTLGLANDVEPQLIVQAPLDIERIYSILDYTRATSEQEDKVMAQQVRSSMIEMSHHGRRVFNEYVDKIFRNDYVNSLRDYGLVPLSYDSVMWQRMQGIITETYL